MTDLGGEIRRLLDAEEAALTSLSVAEMEDCLARKLALAKRLEQAAPAELSGVAQRLRQQERRLAATASGLRAGLRRIAELRSAQGGLRTYSADGGADEICGGPGRLSRNA